MSALLRVRKVLAAIRVGVWRRALLRCGVLAGSEHSPVLRLLGGAKTVVDVGANRGQFALAVRHCLPESMIISFEPLPVPADTYLKVFTGDSRTKLCRVAIGPQSGTATIHLSGRDDSSSLLPISVEQERLFRGTASIGTASIPVATLRESVAPADLCQPALLKLDVQGFELDALRGCEDLLERFDWIYAECAYRELYEGQAYAGDVIEWLRQRGFVLAGVYNTTYDERQGAVQADFLFGRRAGAVRSAA